MEAALLIVLLLFFVIMIVVIAGMWMAFEKAGEPGFACIVPIYNVFVLARVAGMSEMMGLLCLVPIVNIVAYVVILSNVAKQFGRGAGTTLGLIFLAPIFWPILGFGSAEHVNQARKRRRDRDRDRVSGYDDDDERPRRGRRDDDYEDERPSRRRRDDDDDDGGRDRDERIRR